MAGLDEVLGVGELVARFGRHAEMALCLFSVSLAGYFGLQRFKQVGATVAPVTELQEPSPGYAILAGERMSGTGSARFGVVEFFDYECPPCRVVRPKLIGVLKRHPQVDFYEQRYPLSFHPHAKDLALIAYALEPNQRSAFDEQAFTKSGEDLGRVVRHWKRTLSDRDAKWQVSAERKLQDSIRVADVLGLNSTPTLILCDRKAGKAWICRGTQALEQLLTKLDR